MGLSIQIRPDRNHPARHYYKTWPADYSRNFIEFYKSAVVLAVLVPALGAYAGHKNLRKLAKWILFGALVYVIASPIVTYGRLTILYQTGTIHQATIGERIEILQEDFTNSASREFTVPNSAQQRGWSRLSYAGQQAYAMREHRKGNTFDSISDIWIVFVPRIIWPDKPRGIGPGKEFYQYATGLESNRSAVTVYGDAYWNFGWLGLIMIGVSMGFVFGKFSQIAYYCYVPTRLSITLFISRQ